MKAPLTTSPYSPVASAFHCSIDALVIVNLAPGIGHEAFGKDNVPAIMGIHQSLGFTVLVLSLLRLGWRIGHPAPPLPATMPGSPAAAARATPSFSSVALSALPLPGWLMSYAAPVCTEGRRVGKACGGKC